MGRVLLTHLASVAVMLALMTATGESVRIFVYGFFVSYLYRLLTLYGLVHLHAEGSAGWRAFARLVTRPPHASLPSYQVTVGEAANAVPGGIKAYLFAIAVLAGLTFVLVNVRDQEIVTPTPVILGELAGGFGAGLIWWLLDLFDRRITVRFDQDLPTNLGYNSSETTLLAFTTLTGGVASGVMGSPWPYFLALIAFKTWFDASHEVKYPRTEHVIVVG